MCFFSSLQKGLLLRTSGDVWVIFGTIWQLLGEYVFLFSRLLKQITVYLLGLQHMRVKLEDLRAKIKGLERVISPASPAC